MIRLLKPLNHNGLLLEAGSTLTLGEREEKLIATGAAEKYELQAEPEQTSEKPVKKKEETIKAPLEAALLEKSKPELMVYAEQAELERSARKTKKEIIAALIDNGIELAAATGEPENTG